jgi:membrane protease YdiL (CAAX protease family)
MSTHIIGERNPPSPQKSLVSRHPIACFFIMAYGFAWILWFLLLLLSQSGQRIIPFHVSFFPLAILGPVLGPTLAAFIMTAATQGRKGVIHFLGRYVQWRVGFIWYVVVLVGVPAFQVLGAVALPGALQAIQVSSLLPILLHYAVRYVPSGIVINGALAEEPGWRGFALPRLQQRYGPFWGTLLLGILWGCWHTPLFLFVPEWTSQYGASNHLLLLALFIVITISITYCMAWIYNNTKGSLLLMILFHASLTFQGVIQQVFPSRVGNSLLFPLVGYGVAALLLLLLTKGRLSYQPEV